MSDITPPPPQFVPIDAEYDECDGRIHLVAILADCVAQCRSRAWRYERRANEPDIRHAGQSRAYIQAARAYHMAADHVHAQINILDSQESRTNEITNRI